MSTNDRKQRRTENSRGAGSMLTMREACQLLNVHGNTLRRWNAMGLIKAYRIGVGQQRRFKADDVTALVIEQTRFRPTNTRRER